MTPWPRDIKSIYVATILHRFRLLGTHFATYYDHVAFNSHGTAIMDPFAPPPKPQTALGWHRVLSPTANVKVSPIALGGISIGNSWSKLFGVSEDADLLLDTYYDLGGNFIDTSNTYNSEDSERLIGEWMEKRKNRDQMVIATKYGAGYRAYNRENEPLQSNFTGTSAKSMHVSVRDSLRKLKTDYIDILYVHWWDVSGNVEEIMRHLHALVMARQVLYLGVSDTPAWVVVKANECMYIIRTHRYSCAIANPLLRCPPPRFDPFLPLPRQVERRLPRHGSRNNPHVRRPRPSNRILGLARRRSTSHYLSTRSCSRRPKIRQGFLQCLGKRYRSLKSPRETSGEERSHPAADSTGIPLPSIYPRFSYRGRADSGAC